MEVSLRLHGERFLGGFFEEVHGSSMITQKTLLADEPLFGEGVLIALRLVVLRAPLLQLPIDLIGDHILYLAPHLLGVGSLLTEDLGIAFSLCIGGTGSLVKVWSFGRRLLVLRIGRAHV